MTYKLSTEQGGNTQMWMPSLENHTLHVNKGNNKITELRTILQRESQNS
jgi:hypothetical protein